MNSDGLISIVRTIEREAARAERSRQQALKQQQITHRRAILDADKQAKANAKETVRLYLSCQSREIETLNREVADREHAIDNLLAYSLANDPTFTFAELLKIFKPSRFDERPWMSSQPYEENYKLKPLGFFARLVPGAHTRRERQITDATRRFRVAAAEYEERCRLRSVAFEAFSKLEDARRDEVDQNNNAVQKLKLKLDIGEYEAVVAYAKTLLKRNMKGEPDAVAAEVGYSVASRHLVVDLELPELATVPEEVGFKYIKTADRIDPILRPANKRRALYAHLISQAALKCIDTIFRGVPTGLVDCLTLNGSICSSPPL